MKRFNQERSSGILLPIFSLPSQYGIGTLGKEAYRFIDKLHESDQTIWQILPIGHTGYGNSPYSTYSRIAGNPILIDLEFLVSDGLLSESDLVGLDLGSNPKQVDYDKVWRTRNMLFRKAFENAKKVESLQEKIKIFSFANQEWLIEYSLFMALKDHFKGLPVWEWPDEEIIQLKDEAVCKYSEMLCEEIQYYNFIQYKFFEQWHNLKSYANQKNISIMGDLPIYPSLDSADVWGNKELYDITQNVKTINAAGAPPDPFSETGQLWGNPVYNWQKHKENGYEKWIRWITKELSIFDVLRIDHFRGFQAYWAVPAGESTAQNGKWCPGPGKELFDELYDALGQNLPLVAEDLGIITDDVKELLNSIGIPGMKVLVFAEFGNKKHIYIPENWPRNSVGYSSIHDSSTFLGEYNRFSYDGKNAVMKYLNCSDEKNLIHNMLDVVFASQANTVIIPFGDLLKLGDEGRINTPGSVGEHNWSYRMCLEDFSSEIVNELKYLVQKHNR